MTDQTAIDWDSEFAQMERAWEPYVRASAVGPAGWDAVFDKMSAETEDLERSGAWKSGPVDLLHVLGIAGKELMHSAFLAWLLNPISRHGLGASFLAAVLQEAWPFEGASTDLVLVRQEVERRDGEALRRADIVVELPDLTLVIENKLYSDESEDQCEDLYRLWTKPSRDERAETQEVRFVLLSRHGRKPWSATSKEARSSWRGISYRWVEQWLDENLDRIASPVARSTVVQYLIALRSVAGLPATD